MSQEALYRAIVGQDVEPALRINKVPRPYRQTLPAPLAPQVQADIPGMPAREADQPITEDPENDLNPL